jgi:hypothetical protein
MSELDQHPTGTFAVWADAFSSCELELKAIQAGTTGPQFK